MSSAPATNGASANSQKHIRDPKGRFLPGNPGGPGNPFARETAAMRRAFCNVISEENLITLARALFERALQGDVAAARLILSYRLGKPDAAIDPDTLDEQEWQVLQGHMANPDEYSRVLHGLPKDLGCDMAHAMMPPIWEGRSEEMLEQIEQIPDPPKKTEPKQTAKPKEKAAAKANQEPSANKKEAEAACPVETQAAKPTTANSSKTARKGAEQGKSRHQTASNGDPTPEARPIEPASEGAKLNGDRHQRAANGINRRRWGLS